MRNWILAFLAGLAVLAAGVSTQAADMTTMAYSASGGGGANRDGTCELTYTFEERKGG
jgi:hypothetical protein